MTGLPDTSGGYLLTEHARARMTEMNVSVLEMVAVLESPRIIYPYREEGKFTYQGKRISLGVAFDEDTDLPIIITVLWREDRDWAESYEGGRR